MMKDKNTLKITRRLASSGLSMISDIKEQFDRGSWVEYIRESLGMTQTQLAKKVGTDQAAVKRIQEREKEGSVTLKSLEKYADAMNCDLVYAFVPRVEINSYIESKAKVMAKEIIGEASVSMELEDQAVNKEELQEQFNDLVEELKYSKELWS